MVTRQPSTLDLRVRVSSTAHKPEVQGNEDRVTPLET